jgi:hypothetical protein
MANIPKPTNLNTIWASTGTKVDPGVTKTNIGWVVQLPPYEYQNWAMNRQDTAIAHFNQHGVPEWDAITEYQGGLSYTQGSDGLIYKCLQTNYNLDPTNTNNNLFWARAFEDYGSVQIVQAALNAHLTDYATLSGISNVVAARANLSVYSKADGDARYAFKGGDNATPFLVGTATNPQHAVPLSQINSLLVPATESSYGTTQYATTGETEAGTIDDKSITPLKASTILLKKSGNLAGLSNIATARGNLGLGSIATASLADYLATANNLSDLTNPALARGNLQLGSAAQNSTTDFAWRQNNLSDLHSISTARTNLGLTTLATTAPTAVLFKTDNLAGLTNVATARTNLGLGSAATQPTTTFLQRANNLNDLTNVQAARNSLGLGSAATMNAIGTTGSLDFTASGGSTGWMIHPNGIIEQWGLFNMGGGASVQRVNFPRGFNSACWNITMTRFEEASNESGMATVKSFDAGGFTFHHGYSNTFTQYFWRVIGQ